MYNKQRVADDWIPLLVTCGSFIALAFSSHFSLLFSCSYQFLVAVLLASWAVMLLVIWCLLSGLGSPSIFMKFWALLL